LCTVVEGTVRAMRSVEHEEVYCIGREALINAFRRAQTTAIEIQTVYVADKLRLRIRDDGIGVDSRTLGAGSA
jgi:signal transduction histidine kinase